MRIGFVGAGIMGKPMIRNLKKAGFEPVVYARTPSKAEDLAVEGIPVVTSLKDCAAGAGAVITIVGYPRDVEALYLGEGGLLECAAPGTFLIDMTTTSPSLEKRIFEAAEGKGLHFLDAPVTGGDRGAVSGTLSILVGGRREDFEACGGIFRAMGTNINYQGPAGSGQHAKMANQIMIAGTMAGICEALAYARTKGLDLETLLASVSTGAAGSASLKLYGERMLSGDMAPGFMIRHFVKDMGIALEEADASGLALNVLREVCAEYAELEREGRGGLGTQALLCRFDGKGE